MVRRENIRSIGERISVAKPNLENIDSCLSDYFIYFYSAIENYLNRKCEILKCCNSPSLNIKQNSYYIYTHGETAVFDVYPKLVDYSFNLVPWDKSDRVPVSMGSVPQRSLKGTDARDPKNKGSSYASCSVKITALFE